jgi:uncharacterized tellurite resistance protein B-like protein
LKFLSGIVLRDMRLENGMTPTQNLYYALGELAYAIAKCDGTIQEEEKRILHDIVSSEIRKENVDFDYSEIIFTIMAKDHTDSETSYHWALSEIKTNRHYFNEEYKDKFVKVLCKVAEAFPPVTSQEQSLIERFKTDVSKLD